MANYELLNIVTFNVNGLGDFKKRKDMFDFFRKNPGSIFLLQETHWKAEQENWIRSQWGYECYVAGNNTASRGVAVLFKNNFEYKVHNVMKDPEGRYILIDIEMLDNRFTLGNVYGHSSGDHPEFF